MGAAHTARLAPDSPEWSGSVPDGYLPPGHAIKGDRKHRQGTGRVFDRDAFDIRTDDSHDARALAQRRLDSVHRLDGYYMISLFHFCDFDSDCKMYATPAHE